MADTNMTIHISLSRDIHTADAEARRPIGEIVKALKVLEAKAAKTNAVLMKALARLGG